MSRNQEVIEIFDSDDEIEEVPIPEQTNLNQNEAASTDKPPITLSMCRYFLRGECRYGNSCSYLHLDPPPALFSDCVFHNPVINCQNSANNCQNPVNNCQNPVNNCHNPMNNCHNPMNNCHNPMNNCPTIDFSNPSGVSSSAAASQPGPDMSSPQPQRVNIILPPPPVQINVISTPNNGAQIQVINNINVAPQSLLMGRQSVDMCSPSANAIPQTVTSSTAPQSMNGAPNTIQFSSSGPYRLNVLAPIFVPTYQRYAAPESMPTSSSQAGFNSEFTGFNQPTPATSSTNPPATYADVVNGSRPIPQQQQPNRSLCPFAEICPNRKHCEFQHFDQCEICKIFCLHPFDMEARREHLENCTWQQQLTARSKDKVCGICFDRILEKPGKDRLFGLLPNCFHVFCLDCLRRWRRAEHFDREITRGCPECRISSNFVCPCPYWVENKEEKDKIIQCYKSVMSEKDCKYFKKGEGSCPFGNKCFYKHALPNGKKVDVGQPARHVRRVQTSNEEIMNLIDIYMWEFVDRRNQLFNAVNIIGDSDDSDAASEDLDLEC